MAPRIILLPPALSASIRAKARILAPLEMMMGWLLAGGAKPGKVTYSLGLEKEGIRGHITGVVDGDTINVRIPL